MKNKRCTWVLLFFMSGFASAQLTVSFSTRAPGGKYQPHHLLAVYVKKMDGSFVKTIARTDSFFYGDLWVWLSDGNFQPDYDGITGATRRSHSEPSTITATWDFSDRDGNIMPDGPYQLCFDMADELERTHHFIFEKDQNGGMRSAEGTDYFYHIELSYTPDPNPPIEDSDNDGMDDNWESKNGLTVGTDDAALDADHDGATNYSEYITGTDPQSPSSVFMLAPPSPTNTTALALSWSSIAGKTYTLEYTQNLNSSNGWTHLSTNLLATPPANHFTLPPTTEACFYRVKVNQ